MSQSLNARGDLFPFLEILKFTSFNWSEIVSNIRLYKYNNEKEVQVLKVYGKDINWSLVPAGFPACQLIHLEDHFDLKGIAPTFVIFEFLKINLGITLRIRDKMKTLQKRSLRKHTRDYDGPTLELENLNHEVFQAAKT